MKWPEPRGSGYGSNPAMPLRESIWLITSIACESCGSNPVVSGAGDDNEIALKAIVVQEANLFQLIKRLGHLTLEICGLCI